MPDHYCFVCASNEGVFLDVTPDNRSTFGDQVETCFSIKINESVDLSNKICYKCAYELDQCTKFVQKYKKSHEVPEPSFETSMPCCFLCYELVESDRIFDITKDDNVIFNPLRKIRSIFNDNVSKKNGISKLICLTCRYNLDVLYDLKRIYKETIANLKALIDEEISYSNFPKVHTDVVNRKTTITTSPDITFYGSVNSSDNEEDMARGKGHVKGRGARSNAQTKLRSNKSKVRSCDKCHNVVANDIDMYRFYHTGLTVCKNCWITIDPSSVKMQRRSHQVQSNLAETKLCAVFLTDVLNQESCRKEKIQDMEKDKDDNSSCDSSQEETKSYESSPVIGSSKTRDHAVNGKARQGRKRRSDLEKSPKDDTGRTPLKMTRLSKERANTSEMKSTNESVDVEQQSSTPITKRRGRKRIIANRSSDSDSPAEQRGTRRSKINNDTNKLRKKKQRSDLEGTSNARSNSSDEMSNEDSMSLRNKTEGTSSLIEPRKKEDDRSTRSRTRSSSISSIEVVSLTEFKSPKSLAQSEVKTEYTCDKCNKKFDTKLSNAKHRLTHLKQAALKLEKLTVASIKETEVNLQDDKISKEASRSSRTVSVDKHTDDPSEDIAINIEDDTDDEEIFSLSNEQNAKKKLEKEISGKDDSISGKDDNISSEGDSIIDKPDVAKSESRVEEEVANDGNIKIKESERSKESTVALDETVSLDIENDKDRQDKDIKDKHTMEDKNKTSANKDSDKSKDEDAQKTNVTTTEDHKNVDEEKDKDVEIENDTEVSSKEKEKTISECNNDKEDLHEETCDSEPIKSPILSICTTKDHNESCKNNIENKDHNKDHNESCKNNLENKDHEKDHNESCKNNLENKDHEKDHNESCKNNLENKDHNKDHNESCKNNLENNCENDKDEIIEEPEIIQCDLTDDSSKTDTKESEEKVRKILPANKTETLSDNKDLNDIIIINEDNVEALEKQQNRSDEENIEVETIADVDKPNSAKDTIKPDLLNGEKHDEVKDGDEDDVTVVSINSDSNNDRPKDKEVTEETTEITTEDLKEKRKLEEEIKDLEELVKDNATNNKHEVQENSNYILDNNPMDAANEILKEVFELAAAEVQQREENSNTKNLVDVEMETLENISREIRKSADMPSLDPISIMEIDDDNDILLN